MCVNESVIIAESRSNSISCTPIVSQKELQRLTCLNRSSSPLSRFTRKPEQSPVPDSVHRYRFTRNAGGAGSGESQTAPSSPETHKEEEPVRPEAVAEAVVVRSGTDDTTVQMQSQLEHQQQPSLPIPVKTNPVLVHVADYVSSDCMDSVDESDDQVSLARMSVVLPADDDVDDDENDKDDDKDDEQSFPESSEEELPVELMAAPVVSAVTASKSDGQIYRRRCDQLDVSTSSLNQQTQCCMRFKAHPKSSKVKSQSHSCHLV